MQDLCATNTIGQLHTANKGDKQMKRNIVEENRNEYTTVIPIGRSSILAEFFECTKCQNNDILKHHHFCPNCGCKINWSM